MISTKWKSKMKIGSICLKNFDPPFNESPHTRKIFHFPVRGVLMVTLMVLLMVLMVQRGTHLNKTSYCHI